MKTKYLLGFAVLGIAAAASVKPAHAGVSFHVSIGIPLPPPPPIAVPAPCPPRVIIAPPPVPCPPPVVVCPPRPVCPPVVFVPPGHVRKSHGHPRHAGWYYSAHR
jgi:hypothetical protein